MAENTTAERFLSVTKDDDPRDVARRALRAVVTGDMDAIERLFSPDVRLCHRDERGLQGLRGIRERALKFASSLWDSSLTIGYSVVSGDVVVTRWTVQGKNLGWLLGNDEPAGLAAVDGMSITRVSGGRVVEDWSEYTSPAAATPVLDPVSA